DGRHPDIPPAISGSTIPQGARFDRLPRSEDPPPSSRIQDQRQRRLADVQFLPETEEQSALRKLARDVADRDLAPRASHWDETEEFPHDSWRAIADAGLFGVTIGEDYGGAGLTDLEGTIVLEELARADVSSAILCQLICNGAPRAIEHLGNERLRERWLPLAAAGETMFCLGITEPDAGSAVPYMQTR